MGRTNVPGQKSLTEQINERAKSDPDPIDIGIDVVPDSIDPDSLIPTGSTMLDLALSDHTSGGWQMGRIDLLIGDSDSGKTMLALSEFAACAALPRFDNYRFILDAVETNSGINISRLLGKKVADRIEPPNTDKDGDPVYSDTVQDVHDNVLRALDDGRPFLYTVDSVDALSSEEEQGKIEEHRIAREKGKDTPAGSFGGEKPKVAGQLLRNVKKHIKESNSHLLAIFQTRDNIGAGFGEKKNRYSGGRAWKFYAQHEVWLRVVAQLKETKTKLRIGVSTEVDVVKNHLTGKKRDAAFSIFYDYGVDSLTGEIQFLKDMGVLKKKGSYLDPQRLWGLEGSFYLDDLVRTIEEKGLERRVRREVQKAWDAREESIKLQRKPRFE